MTFEVICVGKLKEKYWRDAIMEYSKRIGRYGKINITELKETKLAKNPSPGDELKVIESEGRNILEKIKPQSYVITLEIKGKKLNSETLSDKLENLSIQGRGHVTFIIGGSLGLSEDVSKRSDFKLSFSDMTFPHQMMRVILLEQIYRSYKIQHNEPYHK